MFKWGTFTCVGRQITLCDPIWQVTFRSSETGSLYIHTLTPLAYEMVTSIQHLLLHCLHKIQESVLKYTLNSSLLGEYSFRASMNNLCSHTNVRHSANLSLPVNRMTRMYNNGHCPWQSTEPTQSSVTLGSVLVSVCWPWAGSELQTQLSYMGGRPHLSHTLPVRSRQLDRYQIILVGDRGTCV